jgi:hypothetical protein
VVNSLGLTPAALAVIGSVDQGIGAIGSGNILPHHVTENAGGVLGIIYPVGHPINDPQERLRRYFHERPQQLVLLRFTRPGMRFTSKSTTAWCPCFAPHQAGLIHRALPPKVSRSALVMSKDQRGAST